MAQTWTFVLMIAGTDEMARWGDVIRESSARKPLLYLQQLPRADVAQLVEQPIRNRQVIGSSPIVGSKSNELIQPAAFPTFRYAALLSLQYSYRFPLSLFPLAFTNPASG
jgi:hypothetical protein